MAIPMDWKEKGFGTPFAIDVADFVPKIFEELDSMWTKRSLILDFSSWFSLKMPNPVGVHRGTKQIAQDFSRAAEPRLLLEGTRAR